VATTLQMSVGEAASRKMKAFQFLLAARRPLTAIEMTAVFGWAWAGDVTRAHRPLPAAVKLPAGEGLCTPAQPLRSRRLIGTRRYVLGAVQAGNRMRSGGWRGVPGRQIARSDAPE